MKVSELPLVPKVDTKLSKIDISVQMIHELKTLPPGAVSNVEIGGTWYSIMARDDFDFVLNQAGLVQV